MQEKAPKSPLLVAATIMFLSIFIILPPMFRAYLPKVDDVVRVEIVKHTLYCEKISVAEKKKVTSKISYENDVAVLNVMTFMDYTPTDNDKKTGSKDTAYSAKQEINYLKSFAGIDVRESSSQIVFEITQQTTLDNRDESNLTNYVGDTALATTFYESQGFTCSKQK